MAEKKTYWLADGYGAKALITGADERDRWVPLGWAETDEPVPGDMVWMRHVDHGGPARFPAEVVELWKAKGWEPAHPPEPTNPFNIPEPADTAATTTAAPGAFTSSPATPGKASTGSGTASTSKVN